MTTARYAHLFDEPLRAAAERAGAIITGSPPPKSCRCRAAAMAKKPSLMGWLRGQRRKNPDRPVQDCISEYYALHRPEFRPPPGAYQDYCVREARLGNPFPLIADFLRSNDHSRYPLRGDAVMFVREALQATAKKPTRIPCATLRSG